MKKLQYSTNDPASSTDYLAGDNTWKTIPGGGGGVPTTRNITINGTTQDLSADRTWTVGDMLTSTYDTDVDGVVDSAERIQIVVRNSTGSTLTKGQIVYLSGATGNRPNAVLAQADTEATSSKTIGMVIANIANNADGQIAVNGTLHDLDTSAFTAGDSLWLSATTAGGVVANTPPAEPNHSVFIGYVARAHPTLGRVVLAIQNGYELDELHGVQITTPSNGQLLAYNSTSGLWVNSTPTTPTSKMILGGSGATTALVSGTNYFLAIVGIFIATGSDTTVRTFLREAGTLKSASLFFSTSFTGSLVCTLMVSGVASAMTFTIAGGSAAGVYPPIGSSPLTAVSIAATDYVSLRMVQSGGLGGTIRSSAFTFEI